MDFHAGLRARLLADSGVAAIVGTRVSWLERPQGAALPAITLQVISDPRPQHLKGLDGARGTRVQLDCWAASFAQALALARAAIATLQPPTTIEGKKFGNARIDGQRDLGETAAGGAFVHRQSVDLFIWHVGD
ncbi:tail completion protein gp17 [Sphingobium sp. MI1205]|uniref:tail completion protein gp17 n=1 Tax=Sphingobium sp. MI1205 TaxID=407020 RepID=UPI0007704549|nr:DUF3168 domain-containing protein [Sphingobium sp. MI1205]AMK19333.1 hypothetical protein K663_14775 [Sphingobium sp. MI1205]